MNHKAVEVNQRALVDKILSRYPGEFIVFRELLQNADDAGAKNFTIDFETLHPVDGRASNGTKLDLDSVMVSKWLVKNDGDPFEKHDWNRLTKIAEGNPDAQKIGAFGVGFYSVFSVTDKPVVKSKGKTMTVFYKDGGDKLFVEEGNCEVDNWTTIELKLKQETFIPRTFELTRFLVTSMTFLENIKCVTILLNNRTMSSVVTSRDKGLPIPISDHMNRESPEHNMTINSVEIFPYKVHVTFVENPLIGTPKASGALRVRSEESGRKPTELHGFFHGIGEKLLSKEPAANKYASTSKTQSLEPGTQFTAECFIFSAKVAVTANTDLKKGLRHAIKKDPPNNTSFQLVFFTKEEHDKQMQEHSKSAVGNVFYGPQGLCPPLQGDAARIFIGQSTTQTTGIACHMSGRFIPTMERGSIDLANGQVAKWNKELLYVGGFLARMAYDSLLTYEEWSDAEQDGALYAIKAFTFRQSTPDPTVSKVIEDAFFHCSTGGLQMLSNQGVRYTKDIRQEHPDFAPFMTTTPVLPDGIRLEILPMIKALPEKLRVKPYTFQDVVNELNSRTLGELEMAACLSWWINTIGSQGAFKDVHKKFVVELLKAGKVECWGKEIELGAIQTFIDGRMSGAFSADDPLPEDTIPPPLIIGIDTSKVQHAFDWEMMSIAQWLRHLRDSEQDEAHDIRRNRDFAFHVLTVLSKLWYTLPYESHPEIRKTLEDVPFIPIASPDGTYMHTPKESYFPEANIFHDLPVVDRELFEVPNMVYVLELLGVQKRCDIDTFIAKATGGEKWDVMDLVTYLASSPEHIGRVTHLDIFPCSNGKRLRIHELFVPTDINIQLDLPVVTCGRWSSNSEGVRLLVRLGCREGPTIEDLIRIASRPDHSARHIAFAHLCNPLNGAALESHLNSSRSLTHAFIPSVKNGKHCLLSRDEVFSDRSWALLGLGELRQDLNRDLIPMLKIQERPTASKLIKVLETNPPKDAKTATEWFKFLAEKGVFTAGDFDKIADLKIVPVSQLGSEQQKTEMASPRECFLKSKSGAESPENSLYQQLFKFVDFGERANRFLRACGVKEHPECVDILTSLLRRPDEFYDMAGNEKYKEELRMIAVGYKSLPKPLVEEMRNAQIFLGYRRRSLKRQESQEPQDEYKLCKVQDVLIADDMESRRKFGGSIFVAPQEELLANFYSEMGVKSLSSCIEYIVKPSQDIPSSLSPRTSKIKQSIIDKIPIFLHEFGTDRFKRDMYRLRWHDQTRFSVRGCVKLCVTKELRIGQPWPKYDSEATAETRLNDGKYELWIKEKTVDNYDVAVALCRMLFSAYKNNDVLSLVTILDTDISVLENRGYDVERIRKEYEKKSAASGQDCNRSQSPAEKSRPRKRFNFSLSHKHRKDPKLGEVKLEDIDASIKDVMDVVAKESDENDHHISNREKVGGGKKRKNVDYCNEVSPNHFEVYENSEMKKTGQIKVWKQRGTDLPFPNADCEAFIDIISNIASVFGVNQTRCHVFYHTSDPNLMGYNRDDELYFGLGHYIEKHKKGPLGNAYIDWYHIMAHELAHVRTPYHDEHHELLTAALTAKSLTKFHKLEAMRESFNCNLNPDESEVQCASS